MIEFLKNQPHPEMAETACVSPGIGGVLLKEAVESPAVMCCGSFYDDLYRLFVVKQGDEKTVYIYTGEEAKDYTDEKVFYTFPEKIKSMNYVKNGNDGFLFVLAEKVYMIGEDDVKTVNISPSYASGYYEDGKLYVVADGRIFECKEDGISNDGKEIKAAPYRINAGRLDILYKNSRSNPGTEGGSLIKVKDTYYYTCSDLFTRCARDNMDTFICCSNSLEETFSRRYLLIPNGGTAVLFEGRGGEIYAAFVGSTKYSAVYGKAAVVKLSYRPEGFFRPASGYIYESTAVDSLKPADNIGMSIRDTFIYPAPDGYYYLTGTTERHGGTFWAETNGIHLWRSKDLKNFELIGKIYDYLEQEDSWQKRVSNGSNCWAAEVCYFGGTFWITYSTAPGCGLLKSITGKPEGPYADMGRVVNRGIDSGFFVDNGIMYLVWQNGWIAPLSEKGNVFTQDPVLLMPEDGQEVGYEGAGIIKVNDRYVLYAAEWNGDERIDGTYDMMYSVSDNLYGPYSKRKLLVPHGGHGCLFYDREGELCYTIFGNDRTAPFSRGVGVGKVKDLGIEI